MGTRALGGVVVSLMLLAGCSGGGGEEPVVPTAEEPGPTAGGAEPQAAGGDATVLIGSVGTEDDPDAFVISLTDESGEPVTTLPAGDYTIEVSDPSAIHNFHLEGGSVDETTSVPGTEETTFEVTLEPGEYTYTCDPHPPMTGTFTVT